jgi:hypothetical protein
MNKKNSPLTPGEMRRAVAAKPQKQPKIALPKIRVTKAPRAR